MRPTNSRERLLEVAESLFAQRGYLATSVRDIVHGAGVKPPALYYHFENKEALLVELLEARFEAYGLDMSARLARATTAEEAFRAFGERSLELLRERPDAVRFIFGMLYGPQHEMPVGIVRRLQLRYVELLRRRIAELRPDVAEQKLTFVVVAFQGMSLSITLQSMWLGHDEVPRDCPAAVAARCAAMLDDALPVPSFVRAAPAA